MSEPAATEHRSLLGKAENIASKIHGAADSLSGAFNTKVDQAVHGKSLEKDRGRINRGQEEWNTGKFTHMADRHYDNPSNMEGFRKHPQSHTVHAEQTPSVPVYKPEQETVQPPSTTMGQTSMVPQEYGRVPQYESNPTGVASGPSAHASGAQAYQDQFGNAVPPTTSSHDISGPAMHGGGPAPPGEPRPYDVHHYSSEQQQRPYP